MYNRVTSLPVLQPFSTSLQACLCLNSPKVFVFLSLLVKDEPSSFIALYKASRVHCVGVIVTVSLLQVNDFGSNVYSCCEFWTDVSYFAERTRKHVQLNQFFLFFFVFSLTKCFSVTVFALQFDTLALGLHSSCSHLIRATFYSHANTHIHTLGYIL